jgi:hypothetical protein
MIAELLRVPNGVDCPSVNCQNGIAKLSWRGFKKHGSRLQAIISAA